MLDLSLAVTIFSVASATVFGAYAVALQAYVDQRIVHLQNRVIEPTFMALTKRVATAEKGMKQLAQREVEQEQRVRRSLHHLAAQIVSAADE
ncbi:MAG: hypothetical protein H0X24_00680 [Ktedonobacterales bacterium]|nr:hypothetical protein [Ktedonobacterales bacterium]